MLGSEKRKSVMKSINQMPPSDKVLSYENLVQRFAPRFIDDEAMCQETQRHISLFNEIERSLTTDEIEYVQLLRLLVRRFEEFRKPPRSLALLRRLIEEHRLRRTDLSKILGKSLSLASMILSGQRAITREHAQRLGEYFGRRPHHFLPS